MHDLLHCFGVNPNNKGKDVGIEIEVEGRNLPRPTKYWKAEHDGSLRGNSIEYVLGRPVAHKDVEKVLGYLYELFDKNNTELHDTGRAGIHVHLNVSDLPIIKIFNIVTLYLIFESLYVRFCGESRIGNHFCLRAKDAEGLIDHLVKSLNGRIMRIAVDNIRYASINLKSLGTYGSLEFRAMRSPAPVEVIQDWVDMLMHLKEVALEYENPQEIYMDYSVGGVEELARKTLDRFYVPLTQGAGNWEEEVEASVRICQDLVFMVDWDRYRKKEEANPKPKRYVNIFEDLVEADIERVDERAEVHPDEDF